MGKEIEGHPNNTTRKHLQTLYDLGFKRVSFGVQDYNEAVQKAIHRIQPFENVKQATLVAREIGYTSIGHDIIFIDLGEYYTMHEILKQYVSNYKTQILG